MTEKRFIYCGEENGEFPFPYIKCGGKKVFSLYECADLLNELNNKCDFLEIENESLEDGATKYAELYHEVLKENEQLKQQIKDMKIRFKRKYDHEFDEIVDELW